MVTDSRQHFTISHLIETIAKQHAKFIAFRCRTTGSLEKLPLSVSSDDLGKVVDYYLPARSKQ